MKFSALLFLAALAAFGQPKTAHPTKSTVDKAALEAYLRYTELWIPQVQVKIDDATPSKDLPGFSDLWVHLSYNGGTKDQKYFVSADGKRIIRGDVFELAKSPFQSNLDSLKIDRQPTLGPAGAPVTMVMFSDFECPVCKEEAQILRQNLEKTFPKEVRLYFVDFPLESIHPWAKTAALAGRCVYQKDPAAFWNYFDWVYENQAQITLENFNAKFQEFATSKSLDGMSLGRCIEGKTTEPDVERTIALGHSLAVAATPTTFMNGRKLEGGLPWNSLEQLIKIEIDHSAKSAVAAKSAEECCTLQIPKVGK